MRNIVSKLTELGLSGYEAKAFVALTKDHPATAYEIAKASGIPSSKIYEVLGKLLEKRIISAASANDAHAKTRRYTPMNPEDLLNQRLSTMKGLVDSLKRDFLTIGRDAEVGEIWNICEYDHLIDKALRMIEAAKAVILLSLWPEELERLEKSLNRAQQRGVRIALVHFGPPTADVGQVYFHPIEDAIHDEQGGRGFVMVADGHQVLMGSMRREGETEGAWSQNKGFAALAEDYIKHDVYITKIVRRFEKELIERFGENYALLRDVFRDEETGDNVYDGKGVTRSNDAA